MPHRIAGENDGLHQPASDPRRQPRRPDGLAGGCAAPSRRCPAQRGKANEAVLRLLAAALGIERRRLRIVRGATSRQKVVSVDGLEQEEIRARLGPVSS